jgi:hypothetical protein
VPLLPFPCKPGQLSAVVPQIFWYADRAVAESSPGLAMQVRELIMQEHTFWLTTGGKVGEAENEGPVGQLGVTVFVIT